MKKRSLKKKTPGKLKKDLWKVFSLFIRQRDNFTCFTCGRKGEGGGMHAGHFISKAVGGLALYFHEENVHAQCYHCNINLGGNQYEYSKRLGAEKSEELYRLKQTIVKDFPYDELIEKYSKLIK
jgi:5-methylcytosine-specific restriction endonuclease McrA